MHYVYNLNALWHSFMRRRNRRAIIVLLSTTLLQERPALPQKRESLAASRKVDISSVLLYKLLYFICLDVNHKTQRKAR